jgi:curli biogenesis system outer membrane secretion channel CsgG
MFRKSAVVVASGLFLAVSVPSHAFLDSIFGSGGTKTEDANKKNLGMGEFKGVKQAIGVKGFTNDAGWSGRWDLGNNLSVMLESALFDSGRFVVVEREQLKDIILEQDLAASGRTAKATNVAQTGKIRPARYIAAGSVTTVEDNTSGTDGGINIKGVRLSAGGGKSTVAIIVKIIDTTTGEIVDKQSITGKAGKRGVRVGYSGSSFGGDLGGFAKEPIGEAAQDCIDQAVKFISERMASLPLEGAVVKASSEKSIIINRGSQYGVTVGQALEISAPGEEITDPTTGEVLGREDSEVTATIKITKVQEKMSTGELVTGALPKAGDTVIFK